jgi:hypothetical protein
MSPFDSTADPQPSSAASYTERYCAYLDILGFRGLIEDLDRGRITVDEVHRVLSAVTTAVVGFVSLNDLVFAEQFYANVVFD